METELRIDCKFEFLKVSSIPAKNSKQTGFIRAIYEKIEIRWPSEDELNLIAQWFKRENIYRAFGFSKPISQDYLNRSIVPDMTGSTEPVEILIIRDRIHDKAIGFLLVYDTRRLGEFGNELDLAITDSFFLNRPVFVRNMKICILSYLFAIRGSKNVHWVRRKKVDGNSTIYKNKAKQFLVKLKEFENQLKRIKKIKGPEALPVIYTETLDDVISK